MRSQEATEKFGQRPFGRAFIWFWSIEKRVSVPSRLEDFQAFILFTVVSLDAENAVKRQGRVSAFDGANL